MAHKTRVELVKWSDAELFAYAATHGFSIKSATGAKPFTTLTYSFCYGVGYSDTKFWNITYSTDGTGLPMFTGKDRETLLMILSGGHLETWNAFQAADRDNGKTLQAHQAFLAAQS